MKINESKEALPISFVTDFISRGWTEIGMIKDQIAGMKESFSGTSEIADILQGLLDAYLVSVGQFQLFLEKKKHVVIDNEPAKKEIKENFTPEAKEKESEEELEIAQPKVAKEAIADEEIGLPETVENFDDEDISKENKFINVENIENVNIETPVIKIKNELEEENQEAKEEEIELENEEDANEKVLAKEPFEYFVDFDEPIKEEEEDIYL